jgi:hypothetical protein
MGKVISRTRKSRGRPSTGAESVHLRILPDQSTAIDLWIAKQKDDAVTRPEAIRRLVELGLKVGGPNKAVRSTPNKRRAAELAAKAIGMLVDVSTPAEEITRRRQRLTTGPPEFREHRVDLPKTKK